MNAQPVSTFARGRSTALALILISCHAAAGPSAEIPHSAPESTADSFSSRSRFSISAGWMWRETGGVHFRSGARAPSLALPSLFGRALTTIPPIGTTDTFADRFYTDGTVLMDAGTPLDGSTSAWGYQQEAQAEGGALLYHAQGHRRESEATRSALPPADQAFDGSGGVPVIELGWEKDLSPRLSLGARFQWSFLDFDGSHEQTANTPSIFQTATIFKGSSHRRRPIPALDWALVRSSTTSRHHGTPANTSPHPAKPSFSTACTSRSK